MLISIITPTFNSEKTIERNVRSIVNQTYKHFEHIIVDNISKDNTINIINKVYNECNLVNCLSVISEKDNGISEAFNKGIRRAKGNIIAILNGDDEYYHNNVFQDVVESFKDENIILVHGNVYFLDAMHGSNVRAPINYGISGGIQFIHPTMFFRKSVYDELGLYDEQYRFSMDFEYYCRLAKNYSDLRQRVLYLNDKPIVKMNAGGASWNNELGSIEEIKKALKQYGFWNKTGKNFYFARKYRTILKKYLTRLHLTSAVKIWRRLKYGN